MKPQKYANTAATIIDCFNAKLMTIGAARELWAQEVSAHEPVLALALSLRTKAQIIAKLEYFITWLNEFGRTVDAEAAHAEALEMVVEIEAAKEVMSDMAFHAYWLNCETMKLVKAQEQWNAMHDEALAMDLEFDDKAIYWTETVNMTDAHTEALEMDAAFNAEAARRSKLSVMRTIQNEIMEKPYLPALVEACHAEALEINAQVDSELAELCRVIAGVRRTLYRQEVKQDLIGAACRGVVDGIRERLGVIISRDMLPVITVRAAK
ncbi:hypothetical protein [Lelliottia nimipressuralis]|uniref:Uncharacterized protein n=1 Tax=Lelliottia nimipressuralis TaxID=69220 RepID=A0ABD4KFB0_9ENTR|nr:hypothetical protein [Lelliottia nimipressuralis]MBF4179681.1 hypothetical protein [Lelliottia nimipressuralis]